MSQVVEATLEDLYREPGKAKLIDGRIVRLMPTGYQPHRTAFRIAHGLSDHAEATRSGEAFGVEVRSECDYGEAAEKALAAKRADYSGGGHSSGVGRGPDR